MFYKVVTYINPLENGRIFGTTYFEHEQDAEDFAYHFEALTGFCVAFIEEVE